MCFIICFYHSYFIQELSEFKKLINPDFEFLSGFFFFFFPCELLSIGTAMKEEERSADDSGLGGRFSFLCTKLFGCVSVLAFLLLAVAVAVVCY